MFEGKSIMIYDLETDSLDTETAKIKWFGAYSYLDNEYYLLPYEGNEKDVMQLISRHKVLVGFNNKEFDNPIISNNFMNDNVFDYKVILDFLEISAAKGGKEYGQFRKNRLAQMGIKLKSFTLKNIIEALKLDMEGTKGDIDYKIFQKDEWTVEEIEEIKKYLKQDILLTKKLFEWYEVQFSPLKKFLPEKDQNNFLYLKSSLAVLAYNIICHKAGLKVVFGEKIHTKPYTGAHHIEARWNLVKGNIIEVDFTSAYPHAIMMGNLHSLVGEGEEGWNGNGYYQLEGKYNNKQQGKIELALKDIFLERLKAKKEGDKPKDKSYKIIINCFSEDTDIMTMEGIKKLRDCKVGDLVYSINQKTEEVEIKPIEKMYEQEYRGDMIHFKDKNKDLIVTPEHQMLFKSRRKNKTWIPIKKIEARDVINRSGKYPDIKPITGIKDKYIDMKKFGIDKKVKTSDLFYFIGMVLSEGNIRITNRKEYDNGNVRGISYQTVISQYKRVNPDVHKKIERCLNNIDIKYSCKKNNEGFTISSKLWYDFFIKYKKNGFDCNIPDWCWKYDSSLLEYLHQGLYDGDGTKARYIYSTVSEKLKNDIIRLNLHLGYRTTVCEELYTTKINKLKRKIYRILRTGEGWYKKRDNNHNAKYIKNPTNKVICCSVKDNHTIYAGRNNKMVWTGQSHYGTSGNPVFKSIYNVKTASDCTSMVRTWMKKLAQLLEVNGYTSLYGFTDSIFVLIPDNLNKNHVMFLVNRFIQEAKSHVSFPMETFKMEVEEEIKMIWFVAKNCYLFVTQKNEIKYKSTLLNTNTPKAVMKLFEEYMRPIIIEKLDIPFTRKELEVQLRLILEKEPEIAAQEYKVTDLKDYKVTTSLHYQISEKYGVGRHFLIPNKKNIGVGLSKSTKKKIGIRHCTIEEFKNLGLKVNDIDLTHLLSHLKPFYERNEKNENEKDNQSKLM